MAWLAVDKDETEIICDIEPNRSMDWWGYCERIGLPSGSIEKLIGRKLTWQDEPVEI